MKKHNEGYALVLVLVVITVLSLVAMAMTAASLRNLQNQQKSIERMEAKYTAQGEIEKVIAGFVQKIGTTEEIVLAAPTDGSAINNVHVLCGNQDVKVNCSSLYYGNEIEGGFDSDQDYLKISLVTTLNEETSEKPLLQANCTIKITGEILKTQTDGKDTFVVKMSSLQWEYVSYTITEGGGS